MANKTTINPPVQELARVISDQHGFDALAAGKEEPKIRIHETIGKVAYVYEKVRNAVDYQEEHLIRKNAIARMLKRRILMKERGMIIAEPLIRELIRAGYLANDYFPEKRLSDIEAIINKYISLINAATAGHGFQEKNETLNWVLSVASFELEQYLSPGIKDDALVECMYKIIRPHLDLAKEVPDPVDRDIQIYIAIHRALIKSDRAMLRYHLLYYFAPGWRYITPQEISDFAARLPQLMKRIEEQTHNKMSDRLFRYMKRYAPLFIILKDVMEQNTDKLEPVLAQPNALEKTIRQAAQKRYMATSAKLTRGVIRSIIYIFLTKTLLAFVLELPYEALVLQKIKLLPLGINVVFHPLLMFIIATSIRVPAEKNTQKIIQGLHEIVYDPADKEIFRPEKTEFKTSPILQAVFSFLYFIAYVITFGGIIWLLHALEFSIVSAALFIFFLCVISFFGLRLRHNAQELVVISRRDNLFIILFDFFTLPIIRAGSWIARKTSKVNVFMFIMDYVLEAPFKVLVETVEDWVSFQRQKKDEIF